MGMLPGKLLLSLPPALAPLPIPGPRLQAFRIRSHREGKFFIGVMKIRPLRNPNFAEPDPGRPESPGKLPILLPLLSPLPPPLGRWLESSSQKAGNGTFGGATPGDLFLPITSLVRMAEWPISTVSPSSPPPARTSRRGKA